MDATLDATNTAAAATRKLDDLRQRQAQREADRRATKAAASQQPSGNANESLDHFLATFTAAQQAIETDIAQLDAGAGAAPIADAGAVKERLDAVARAVLRLQQESSAAALYLPDSVVQRTQTQLGRLTSELEAVRQRLLPKKRFGFRGARTAPNDEKPPPPAQTNDVVLTTTTATPAQGGADESDASASVCQLDWTVCNRSGVEIRLSAAETDGRDIRLSGLHRCVVRLEGRPGSLQLSDCDECWVRCAGGPVARSVFGDRVRRSTLVFACQQSRLHRSQALTVYMHCGSRPVIEECSGVRVAPYRGEDVEVGFPAANENWSDVADFDWLAGDSRLSPNWCVVPEAERRSDWLVLEEEWRQRLLGAGGGVQ